MMTILCALGVSMGLFVLFISFFIRNSRKEFKRINSISSTVITYRQTKDSFLTKIKKYFSKQRETKNRHKNNKTDLILEILKQPGKPLSLGYKDFKTLKGISPFLFTVLFGFAGLASQNILILGFLIAVGFFTGITAPTILLLYLYAQYKEELTNELSEAMTYIVDLRKAGHSITDSIKGSLFATNRLKPHLEKLLQEISLQGPRIALAKLSKETDIEEFRNFADILLQSITIDNTHMVAYMESRSKDIDYIEGLKEMSRYKKRKMIVEALTTIPFIMIPIIILVPLLLQANQNLSQVM
ncbi:hypothetical protein A7K50_01245 [Dehalobacter sp. MCB1]|uniref:type II secretion system F family protein n=1 Tax=unclassified Dehalobacter TaxID=2635733 RepID=UPI000E6C3FA2|nr:MULTISPECIES: hypothetical protein [unclassified Dehalobacter]RJE47899.1 hypothetical protein A7K50_01245 [Dehalobacter sp. MCB1]TCX56077.1 hypothetical protein C1I38_00725 [Dehalobacter sp. 12DCB1]